MSVRTKSIHIVIVLFFAVYSKSGLSRDIGLEAIPEVQVRLVELPSVYKGEPFEPGFELYDKFQQIVSMVGNDRVLAEQLIYMFTHSGDLTVAALPAYLMVHGVSKETLIDVLVPRPYDENGKMLLDPDLMTIIETQPDGSKSLEPFAQYFLKHQADPPTPLMRYFVGGGNVRGIELLAEAYIQDATRKAEVLQANQMIKNELEAQRSARVSGVERDIPGPVAEALDELSRSDDWWQRLYVSSIMKRDKAFDKPALRDRLRNDPNEYVRAAIAELDKKRPLN